MNKEYKAKLFNIFKEIKYKYNNFELKDILLDKYKYYLLEPNNKIIIFNENLLIEELNILNCIDINKLELILSNL